MGETRIPGLDGQESAAWLALISMTTWLPAALDQQLTRDDGITNSEYGALSALARSKTHSVRIKDLARLANCALPRISKMINRFERHGWVTREPDPDDGRATLAVLTRDGYRKIAAATPGHIANVRRLVFDNLTPAQVAELARAASTILDVAHPGATEASECE